MKQIHIAKVICVTCMLLTCSQNLIANPLRRGQYVGISYNYSWNKNDVDVSPSGTVPSNIYNANLVPHSASWYSNGSAVGILLGFNRSMPNNLIWGAEIDYQQANIHGSPTVVVKSFNGSSGSTSYVFEANTKLQLFGTARLKFGTMANEDTFIGITGGYILGRLHQSGSITQNNNGVFNRAWFYDDKSNQSGWCIGLISEYNAFDNFTIGLQYLFYQFASYNVASNGTTTAASGTFNYSFENQGQLLKLNISYHFL